MSFLNALLPWVILAAGIIVLGVFMVIRHRVSPIWFLFPAALCGLAVLFLLLPDKKRPDRKSGHRHGHFLPVEDHQQARTSPLSRTDLLGRPYGRPFCTLFLKKYYFYRPICGKILVLHGLAQMKGKIMGFEAFWPYIGLTLLLGAGYWAYQIAQNGVEHHERWPLGMSLVMGGIGALMVSWPEGQHVVSWLLIFFFGGGVVCGVYVFFRSQN